MPVKLDSDCPDLFPLASNSILSFSDDSNEPGHDENSNASDLGHSCSEEKRRRSSKDCNKENCSDNDVQNVDMNIKDDLSSADGLEKTNRMKEKKPLLTGPLPLAKSQLPGVNRCLLYNGSRFVGHQKSKGSKSCYDVEVILQHVDKPNSYLCGYLKIAGKLGMIL